MEELVEGKDTALVYVRIDDRSAAVELHRVRSVAKEDIPQGGGQSNVGKRNMFLSFFFVMERSFFLKLN